MIKKRPICLCFEHAGLKMTIFLILFLQLKNKSIEYVALVAGLAQLVEQLTCNQ